MNMRRKPRIVVSKCLEFAPCRYNGQMISSPIVKLLKDHVEFIPVCPEMEVGLGVPRNPIRVCRDKGGLILVQPATGLDVTLEMRRFVEGFLDSLEDVDGFILKNRSPSCGIGDVKIYQGPDTNSAVERGSGFFGGVIQDHFPLLPIEDEGRLSNFRIREHFLTQLYTAHRFNLLGPSPAMKEIVRFQSEHKLLLMAYNQARMREMGRIVANHEKLSAGEVFEQYGRMLNLALRNPPRYTSNINVLMHAFGYFSKKVSDSEKAFFLDSLEKYRAKRIPLSTLLYLTRSWVLRFEEKYLMDQVYFMPYPETLMEVTDSGKGRKL